MSSAPPAGAVARRAASGPARTAGADLALDRPAPSRSPERLRRLQFVSTLAVLVFTVLTVVLLVQVHPGSATTSQRTVQAVRVVQLESEVTRAGRLAATAAVAGDTTADELSASLQNAATLVVEASAAGADADLLGAANGDLADYAALLRKAVAAPDAATRASLLTTADGYLSGTLMPQLEQARAATIAPDQSGGAASTLSIVVPVIAVAGLAVLALLGWSWLQVSRLSHRVVNPGLAAATLLIALTVGVVLTGLGTSTSTDTAAAATALDKADSYATLLGGAETSARLQAEAVLVGRQSTAGAQAEKDARAQSTTGVRDDTPSSLRKTTSAAITQLKSNAELITAGRWSDARAAVLATNDASVTAKLAALAKSVDTANEKLVDGSTDSSGTASRLTGLTVLAGALGAVAVVAVIWGIWIRLKEYR